MLRQCRRTCQYVGIALQRGGKEPLAADNVSSAVVSWWVFLCAVAAINLAAWLRAADDIPRICLVDTGLSSVLVGRRPSFR